jgi:glycosyltransferase involved in cell wall biosynthesis
MSSPMTIAHVTAETGYSGGESQVFLLMEGLRKRGHHNVLLCPDGSLSQQQARRRGLETRTIRARSEWSPGNLATIRRRLLECAPDLVHLHTGRANWLGGLACWQLGLPAITTRRMDRPVKRDLRTRFLYGRAVRRAVAISHAVEQRLVASGVPASMVRVIHSAVDPEALFPQRSRDAVRAELDLPAETPCLLCVAALVQRKGIDVLLEAVEGLARRGDRPLLLVAGEGESRGALERTVRAQRFATQVRFLGRRSDVPDLLAACDIFVLPSRQEGLGVAALEAMALARPVVVTRAGGLGETAVDGRTGFLVPPDDPEALERALRTLLRDPELRARLGGAGPGRVAEGFLAEQLVEAYERLYREVLVEAGLRP